MLDNGQAQSRAADGAGVALIHPVEPLKDPALLCRRDADAGIPDSEGYILRRLPGFHGDAAAGDIVFHRIFAEVVHRFRQQPPDAGHGGRRSDRRQRHVPSRRQLCQGTDCFQRQILKIHRLRRQLSALVQLGQADNVVDERHQPFCLLMDPAQEAGAVLRLCKSRFQQLRAADDGLQRRFQLMGHIGGEFPPHPLSLRLLRHVKGQQHNAQRVAAGVDTAEVELIDPSAPLRPQLAVAGFHGAADGGAEIRVPLHR